MHAQAAAEPDRPSPGTAPRLAARRLTKSYGGVTVLDGVDLTLAAGEVRALLGENGAGKSTLIKILSGVTRPDRAELLLDGASVELGDPASAQRAGIATLHQELSIVPGLSVAENALLGQRLDTRWGAVRRRRVEARARALFAELGHPIDVTVDVAKLSPVGRTMTALARALAVDSRVLILDEPTAGLTDAETSLLFSAMRRLRTRGVAIVYVSHRLEEVQQVCDTYTVLRNGRMVREGRLADTTIDELIAAMAGRPLEAIFPPRVSSPGRPVLTVAGLSGPRIRNVSFEVRAGEVFGIAGLAGAGRSEIVRILAGLQRRTGGTVTLRGAPYRPRSVRAAQRTGVALVPQERRADGLVPDGIERNANLTTVDQHTTLGFVTSTSKSRRHALGLTEQLRLRYHHLDQQVLTLSGGNQQKVVLAKYLALAPDVLLLDEPTRGVDVATKREIYHLIEDRAAAGGSVVVVSSELPELLGLAHRILVLHEGRPIATFEAAATDQHELLLACYGRTR